MQIHLAPMLLAYLLRVLVIEAKDNNEQLFLDESADLLFHYLILLQSKGYQLDDVVKVLAQRHKP
jgi:phosphoribosyl-ATP pyrophosphohydrolase/phosphoribosyl-AMP cyclohydrolase